jgi:uncharacterized membrane protein YtjA (UPF0391 family)
MLRYALIFFGLACIAAGLGFAALAGIAAGLAKGLAILFLVLALISFVVSLSKKGL